MKKILLSILILILQQDLLATEALIIDVRTDSEWKTGFVEDAKHIPINDLEKRLKEIQAFKDEPIFTYWHLKMSQYLLTVLLAEELSEQRIY
tara:strand:- start:257 stop:532 length:276 start_codon:yes stop_codon:yes gene_type:complete